MPSLEARQAAVREEIAKAQAQRAAGNAGSESIITSREETYLLSVGQCQAWEGNRKGNRTSREVFPLSVLVSS